MANILFFGRLADIAGGRERDVQLPAEVKTLGQLRDWLGAGNPALAEALDKPSIRAAINKTIAPVREDLTISDSDEIAFMPPVSGG